MNAEVLIHAFLSKHPDLDDETRDAVTEAIREAFSLGWNEGAQTTLHRMYGRF